MSKELAPTGRWQRDAAHFLLKLWSGYREGYTFLAARNARSPIWREMAINLVSPETQIERFFDRYDRTDYDLYFTPNHFEVAERRASSALCTRFAWVDIDSADPRAFSPGPNLLWRTSPGRHQGVWIFKTWMSPPTAQLHSKALAYDFGADRTGWSSTKMLRVPFTYNHKPSYRRPVVRLLEQEWTSQANLSLRAARQSAALTLDEIDPTRCDPAEVFERVRSKLHLRVRVLIRSKRCSERDRSKCIFEIIAGLHEVGCLPDEIGAVLWSNPYFTSKWGEDLAALTAEISRVIARLERAEW